MNEKIQDEDLFSMRALSKVEDEIRKTIAIPDKKEVSSKPKNTSKKMKISDFILNEKIKALQKDTEEAIDIKGKAKNSQNFIKSLVSKDKKRFCFDGFDLDLSYITPRIIAMGIPCTSYEALYRNDMAEVLNFFNTRHPQHYKVYNICEEKRYAENIFYKQGSYPFRDREAPPLNMIKDFCEDAKAFLTEDPKNVIAVHCLAGKGRTGTLISCLLLYLGLFDRAFDSLVYFGIMRVGTGIGVNEPSQIRYVFYFEQILKKHLPHPIIFKKLRIRKIRMWTIPAFNKFSFVIENKVDNNDNVFDYHKKETPDKNVGFVDFEAGEDGFEVCGDVKIQFYTFSLFGSKEKIFKLWFNTNFVPADGVLEIKKDLVDTACKDQSCKKFSNNFKIEVHVIDVDI